VDPIILDDHLPVALTPRGGGVRVDYRRATSSVQLFQKRSELAGKTTDAVLTDIPE
jgi:hypothetical protein